MIIDHPEMSVHGNNNTDDDSEGEDPDDDSGEDPGEGFFLKARVVHEDENSDSDSEVDDSDNDSKVDDTESEDPEEILFAKAGFQIIMLHHIKTFPASRLLACVQCLTGTSPTSVLEHCKKKHDIVLTRSTQCSLQKILHEGNFKAQSTDVESPKHPSAPFDGLMIQNGFKCNICSYCSISLRTMANHHSSKHKGAQGSSKENSEDAEVQAFFSKHPKYFAVISSLHGLEENDLFAIYLKNEVPKIEGFKHSNPPLTVNEVPPLLKLMQWHQHLAPYIGDRKTAQQLLEIWTLPTSKDPNFWLGKRLRSTIQGYMKDIRTKTHSVPSGIKRLLKTCPRYVFTSALMLHA